MTDAGLLLSAPPERHARGRTAPSRVEVSGPNGSQAVPTARFGLILHARFPAMRLAGDPARLRWGHGDGLVLRGLSELPVHLGVDRGAM